jgi:hypothetical protein
VAHQAKRRAVCHLLVQPNAEVALASEVDPLEERRKTGCSIEADKLVALANLAGSCSHTHKVWLDLEDRRLVEDHWPLEARRGCWLDSDSVGLMDRCSWTLVDCSSALADCLALVDFDSH